MLTFLSLPLRFLGATTRRPVVRRRSPAPRRATLAVEWLERREVPAVTFTPAAGALHAAKVGASYSQSFTATGTGTLPYHYSVASGLPAGLKMSDAGVLSGTPTAAGSFSFTVKATDSTTGTPATGSQNYTLTVSAPTITLRPTKLTGPAGAVFGRTITATGGTAPYTFSVKGSMPSGLSLVKGATNNTAIIKSDGTIHAASTFTFTISVHDNSTGTGSPFSTSQTFTLTTTPSQLVFVIQPGSAAVNANLPPFAVEALDQSGKPVTGQVTLTLITVVSEATARFKSGSTTKVTLTNGVATFSNVAITARGRYVLKATIGSVSIFSDFFDIALNGRHSPGE